MRDNQRGARDGLEIDGLTDFEPLGSGGFSRVYSANQLGFDRRVAVKVLMVAGVSEERDRQAFERECRAMGQLSDHPFIVTVFTSTFTKQGEPVIVMELCPGGTLSEKTKSFGRLPIEEVLDTGVKIAGALQAVHDHGVFHRDLKPNNIFVNKFNQPALGDFGISSFEGERTVTGGGGFTMHYAPPEALDGSPATPQSELYSLAASLYTLAAGTRPFGGQGQSTALIVNRILREPPPRIGQGIPESLEALFQASMAKDPTERPDSARTFGQRVQTIQTELGLATTELVTSPSTGPTAEPPAASSTNTQTRGQPDTPLPNQSPPLPPRLPSSTQAPAAVPHFVAPEITLDHPPAEDHDDSSATVTVARSPEVVESAEEPPSPVNAGRLLGAAAALALVVGGVAVAAIVLSGGNDKADGSASASSPSTTFDFDDDADNAFFGKAVTTPQNVTVERKGSTSVEVYFAEVDNAVSYQIIRVDADATDDTAIEVTASPAVIAIEGDTDKFCSQIRAVGQRGALSTLSPVRCS